MPIREAKVGMKVIVHDPFHCCLHTKKFNHKGIGTVIKVSSMYAFLVRMDNYPDESWLRCKECVSSLNNSE